MGQKWAGVQSRLQILADIFSHVSIFSQIPPCVITTCYDPPDKEYLKLRSDWFINQVSVKINESVSYYCSEPGYFFDTDRTQTSFEIKCMENGFFELPLVWPACTKGIFCNYD